QCCAGLFCGPAAGSTNNATMQCQPGCRISGTFYSAGARNPANGCQSCQPAVSTSAWRSVTNGTACNADSNGCTQNDSCQSGTCTPGSAPNCVDGLSCTTDTCNSTGNNAYGCRHTTNTNTCLIGGTCYAE